MSPEDENEDKYNHDGQTSWTEGGYDAPIAMDEADRDSAKNNWLSWDLGSGMPVHTPFWDAFDALGPTDGLEYPADTDMPDQLGDFTLGPLDILQAGVDHDFDLENFDLDKEELDESLPVGWGMIDFTAPMDVQETTEPDENPPNGFLLLELADVQGSGLSPNVHSFPQPDPRPQHESPASPSVEMTKAQETADHADPECEPSPVLARRVRGPIHHTKASQRPCYPVGWTNIHGVDLTDASCYCGAQKWTQPSDEQAGCSWGCLVQARTTGVSSGNELLLCRQINKRSVDGSQIGHLTSFKLFSSRPQALKMDAPGCGSCVRIDKVFQSKGAEFQHTGDVIQASTTSPSRRPEVTESDQVMSRLTAGDLSPADIREAQQTYGFPSRPNYQTTVSCTVCPHVTKVDINCRVLVSYDQREMTTSEACARLFLKSKPEVKPWVICESVAYTQGSAGHVSTYDRSFNLKARHCNNHRDALQRYLRPSGTTSGAQVENVQPSDAT